MPRFEVVRSIEIEAPPQRVFDTVADFGTWTTWSPWLCAEPTADVTVSENPNSVGSLYTWNGDLVGQGEIEHRRLEPPRSIEEELRFIKPWKSQSDVDFEITPVGEGSRLEWRMRGSLPWFMFWMKSQMEAFISMDYDRGLSMLKQLIETGHIHSTTRIEGVVNIGPLHVAGVRKTCAIKDIGPSMDAAIDEAREKLPAAGLSIDGELISVYHNFKMKEQVFDYTSGFILAGPADSAPGLSTWSMPASKALRVDHVGSYSNLGNSWSAANQYARYKKLKQSKVGAFEIYKNDPHSVDESELLTEIYLPLR